MNRRIYILLGIVAAIASTSAFVVYRRYIYVPTDDRGMSPEDVARNFCQHVIDREYELVESMYTDKSRKVVVDRYGSFEAYCKKHWHRYSNYIIGKTSRGKSDYFVMGIVCCEGDMAIHDRWMHFIIVDSEWKIEY